MGNCETTPLLTYEGIFYFMTVFAYWNSLSLLLIAGLQRQFDIQLCMNIFLLKQRNIKEVQCS